MEQMAKDILAEVAKAKKENANAKIEFTGPEWIVNFAKYVSRHA